MLWFLSWCSKMHFETHLQDLEKIGWFQYKNLTEKKIVNWWIGIQTRLVKLVLIGQINCENSEINITSSWDWTTNAESTNPEFCFHLGRFFHINAKKIGFTDSGFIVRSQEIVIKHKWNNILL